MQGGTARTGVWIIGSRGSVATTAITGAAAVTAGLATTTGLVTMRPPFIDAGLPGLGELVFGGHDVIETPLAVRAARLVDGGVLPVSLPEAVAAQLAAAEGEMRPASPSARPAPSRSPRSTAPAPTWPDFRARHDLDRVVVLNLCSTEPPAEPHPAHADPDDLLEARRPRLGPAAELDRRARRDRVGRRVRRLHALGRALASRRSRRSPSARHPASPAGRQDRRDASERRSPRCSRRAGCTCARGRGRTCSAAATAPRSPIPTARRASSPRRRAAWRRSSAARRAPVHIDNVPDLGDVEDGLGPHPRRGLPRLAHHDADRSGAPTTRCSPRRSCSTSRASLALRGAADAGGVVPELGFFFKDPCGQRRARLERQYDRPRSNGRTRPAVATPLHRGPPGGPATTVARRLDWCALPAVLTVSATCCRRAPRGPGRDSPRRRWLLPLASVFLYLGGMALTTTPTAGRRGRAAGAADPVRPRHARLRARHRRRVPAPRPRTRRDRRTAAGARGRSCRSPRAIGRTTWSSSRRPPDRRAWPPAAGSTC